MEIIDVEKNLNEELSSYFKGEKDGYVQVGKKKWLLPAKYRQLAEEYKNFEVRDDDIWILGYPRSGTTLTEEIVWLITHDMQFEESKKERPRLFENSLILNDKVVNEIIQESPREADFFRRRIETLRHLKEQKTRRVIKTHLPIELLPDDILKKGCKVIYVCRHPKDVCVSYFNLQKSMRQRQFCGEFDKFLEFFRNGNCAFDPYFEHVQEAFDKIGTKNFIFIFFEEFIKDSRNYSIKLSEFVGNPLTEKQLEELKEHMKFDNFRRALLNNNYKPDNSVTKGVGSWKKWFTEEMNRKTDEWIETNVKRIGITFPQLED